MTEHAQTSVIQYERNTSSYPGSSFPLNSDLETSEPGRTNEVESRKFLKKLNRYTKWRFNFFIMWQTRKTESIFKLKDKITHPSHVIYKGKCNCGVTYIGETARNLEVRVNEHSDVNKQSEPVKHIRKHPNHKFTWNVLTTAHSW
ncbi:hypothetical protein ACROYT_G020110 [Oculina patagonica]